MLQGYNYMIERERPRTRSRSPVHKRDELRKIYQNILKLNKDTGYYKINLSLENQEYTLGVKDIALQLKENIRDLQAPDWLGYEKRRIVVSDEEVLTAEWREGYRSGLPEYFTMEVEILATPQKNRGHDLFYTSNSLKRGDYDFRLHIRGNTYDLSFQQVDNSDNLDTMNRLAGYLEQSIPELIVSVEEGAKNYYHITLQERLTGKRGDKRFTFEDHELYRNGIVELFGLNRVEQPSKNAEFMIDNVKQHTNSNTFQIEKAIQVTLHRPSDQPVTIQLVRDSDVILEGLNSLLTTVNDLIHIAESRQEESRGGYKAVKLINEIKIIEGRYREEMEAYGIIADESGELAMDEQGCYESVASGEIDEFLTNENGFVARLLRKAEQIAINPMEYLDKVIVTYPNHKGDINPYITSVYSGLLFSSYC